MEVQFIIEGKEGTDKAKAAVSKFAKGNGIKIVKNKISGENNYYLALSRDGKSLTEAKYLSQARDIAIDNLEQTKFKLMLDEPSIKYSVNLFPLLAEYENKLRKILYFAFFDLEKTASEHVQKKMNDVSGKYKIYVDKDKYNMFTAWTLNSLFGLIFNNDKYIRKVQSVLSDTNKIERCTKTELIEKIKEITEEDSIWCKLIKPNFSEWNLVDYYNDINKARHRAMHFHTITDKQFRADVKIIRKAIKEIDAQIAKSVVLEDTKEGAEILSSNTSFIYSLVGNKICELSSYFDVVTKNISMLSSLLSSKAIADALAVGEKMKHLFDQSFLFQTDTDRIKLLHAIANNISAGQISDDDMKSDDASDDSEIERNDDDDKTPKDQ